MRLVLLSLGMAVMAISYVSGFGSEGIDRFAKKWAMMKAFESCFGQKVISDIRKELKAACAKCSATEQPPSVPAPSPKPTRPPPAPPSSAQTPSFDDHKLDGGINDPENSIYANQQAFDADKLHQAILAFRPNPSPMSSFRPYSPAGPGYYPGFPSPAFAGPMYFTSGYHQPQQQPFGVSPYGFPYLAQPSYSGSSRMSREMDLSSQIDPIIRSDKLRNVTCVMQELGYMDENLQPNYEKIKERIGNLPVSLELKRDMQEGVDFCQQFTQCLPESKRKSLVPRDLVRPLYFFRCYKHKKLEACVLKDIRERYDGLEEYESDVEFGRRGKAMKAPSDGEIDDMAASMYEFLYSSSNGEQDLDIGGMI